MTHRRRRPRSYATCWQALVVVEDWVQEVGAVRFLWLAGGAVAAENVLARTGEVFAVL